MKKTSDVHALAPGRLGDLLAVTSLVSIGTLAPMTSPERPDRFDPVAAMPHADGTLVLNGSVTLRVHAQPGIPEQRLLSVVTGRVVGGKLLMKFSSVRLPDRNEQFAARMRRQRLQR